MAAFTSLGNPIDTENVDMRPRGYFAYKITHYSGEEPDEVEEDQPKKKKKKNKNKSGAATGEGATPTNSARGFPETSPTGAMGGGGGDFQNSRLGGEGTGLAPTGQTRDFRQPSPVRGYLQVSPTGLKRGFGAGGGFPQLQIRSDSSTSAGEPMDGAMMETDTEEFGNQPVPPVGYPMCMTSPQFPVQQHMHSSVQQSAPVAAAADSAVYGGGGSAYDDDGDDEMDVFDDFSDWCGGLQATGVISSSGTANYAAGSGHGAQTSGGTMGGDQAAGSKTDSPCGTGSHGGAGRVRGGVGSTKKMLIVVDGANCSHQFTQNKGPDLKALPIVVEYFEQKGCDVIVFLPTVFSNDKGAGKTLKELIEQKKLCYVPARDDDDRYFISYAMEKQAAGLVSNDLFRNHVQNLGPVEGKRLKDWLVYHRISYAYVRDEFMPNPTSPVIADIKAWHDLAQHGT